MAVGMAVGFIDSVGYGSSFCSCDRVSVKIVGGCSLMIPDFV